MSLAGDLDGGAFYFMVPYLLRDTRSVLLPLWGVSELSLYLLLVPRPEVFGFVYERGIGSPFLKFKDTPSTGHHSDDKIPFFGYPSRQGHYGAYSQQNHSNRAQICDIPRGLLPPSDLMRPMRSCQFGSQDRAHPSSRHTSAPTQQQQGAPLR